MPSTRKDMTVETAAMPSINLTPDEIQQLLQALEIASHHGELDLTPDEYRALTNRLSTVLGEHGEDGGLFE